MTLRTDGWILSIALPLALGRCGGSSGGSSDGGTCGAMTACGGAVDGTWQIDSLCTEGDLVKAVAASLGLPDACANALQSASLSGSGTVTFANGTETDNVTQIIDVKAALDAACLSARAGVTVSISAALCSTTETAIKLDASVKSVACAVQGATCGCSITLQNVDTSSMTYNASGGTITYTDGSTPSMSYCVQGTKLTARQPLQGATDVTLTANLHKI